VPGQRPRLPSCPSSPSGSGSGRQERTPAEPVARAGEQPTGKTGVAGVWSMPSEPPYPLPRRQASAERAADTLVGPVKGEGGGAGARRVEWRRVELMSYFTGLSSASVIGRDPASVSGILLPLSYGANDPAFAASLGPCGDHRVSGRPRAPSQERL